MTQKLIRDMKPGDTGHIWITAIEPNTGAVNLYAPVFDEASPDATMAAIWMTEGANHRSPYKILVPAGVETEMFASMARATIVLGADLMSPETGIDLCIADAVATVQAEFAERDAQAA